MVLPIIVAAYVLLLPESPRWLLNRAHKAQDIETMKRYYNKAFNAMTKLRPTKLQAARDFFLLDHELQVFEESSRERHGIFQEFWTESRKFFFKERRSWRALLASVTCMFFQQVSVRSAYHVLPRSEMQRLTAIIVLWRQYYCLLLNRHTPPRRLYTIPCSSRVVRFWCAQLCIRISGFLDDRHLW